MHDNAVAYNDPENCTPLGFYKIRNSTEAKNNAIKIFPNPVSNLASVVYAFEEESKGELMIYDLVGTKILTVELNSNSKKVEFSTSNLVNGVYGYVIMKNELPISQGKFVVIK